MFSARFQVIRAKRLGLRTILQLVDFLLNRPNRLMMTASELAEPPLNALQCAYIGYIMP